jgi:hypothetical protein
MLLSMAVPRAGEAVVDVSRADAVGKSEVLREGSRPAILSILGFGRQAVGELAGSLVTVALALDALWKRVFGEMGSQTAELSLKLAVSLVTVALTLDALRKRVVGEMGSQTAELSLKLAVSLVTAALSLAALSKRVVREIGCQTAILKNVVLIEELKLEGKCNDLK